MKSGAPTDIATGKPLEQVASDNEQEKQFHDEALLKSKVEFLGLTGSPDGKQLIALVQAHLDRRIDELVTHDPKAQGFVAILSDMGMKENEARKAAQRLVNMRIKNE